MSSGAEDATFGRAASLVDAGGWEVADAFGVGPAVWVARVVEE